MPQFEYLIDGMMSGTGIRDAKTGSFVDPESLGLSTDLRADLAQWAARYEAAHYMGFPPSEVVTLDEVGLSFRERVRSEIPGAEVGYYSDGLMKRLG